jgi:hypothetical protein
MSDDNSSAKESGYKADPKIWIIFVVIVCIATAIPLYVYFTKKYCPAKLPRCFQMRGEREHWPQRHKGGMFGEEEQSDHEGTVGSELRNSEKI